MLQYVSAFCTTYASFVMCKSAFVHEFGHQRFHPTAELDAKIRLQNIICSSHLKLHQQQTDHSKIF
jgi:hypothetical protein